MVELTVATPCSWAISRASRLLHERHLDGPRRSAGRRLYLLSPQPPRQRGCVLAKVIGHLPAPSLWPGGRLELSLRMSLEWLDKDTRSLRSIQHSNRFSVVEEEILVFPHSHSEVDFATEASQWRENLVTLFSFCSGLKTIEPTYPTAVPRRIHLKNVAVTSSDRSVF